MPGCSSLASTRASLLQPALEAGAGQRVGNLDRDLATELFVDGEEDRAHAAAADLLDDRVAAGLELRPAAERPQAVTAASESPLA